MIESSGAYTREEPVLSLGRAITEVGEFNFHDHTDWLLFSVEIISMNMITKPNQTYKTGWQKRLGPLDGLQRTTSAIAIAAGFEESKFFILKSHKLKSIFAHHSSWSPHLFMTKVTSKSCRSYLTRFVDAGKEKQIWLRIGSLHVSRCQPSIIVKSTH